MMHFCRSHLYQIQNRLVHVRSYVTTVQMQCQASPWLIGDLIMPHSNPSRVTTSEIIIHRVVSLSGRGRPCHVVHATSNLHTSLFFMFISSADSINIFASISMYMYFCSHILTLFVIDFLQRKTKNWRIILQQKCQLIMS